jgi:predicted small metal-binding protein
MTAIGNLVLADKRPLRTLGKSKGENMRAIDYPCGHHLEGADDDELFRLAREHIGREHPEMQRTDDRSANVSQRTPMTLRHDG